MHWTIDNDMQLSECGGNCVQKKNKPKHDFDIDYAIDILPRQQERCYIIQQYCKWEQHEGGKHYQHVPKH